MRLGITGPQDVLALLVRRRWWIVGPFIALSCAVGVLTYVLPQVYVSEALILVRPRDVPTDLVRDLIAGSPEQRLKSIQQTVLSRTIIMQLLTKFSPKLPEFKRLNNDERIAKLRSQILITFNMEKDSLGRSNVTSFRISYSNRNPNLAQEITREVTTLFIDQDNKARETQVYGTTTFFAAELEKVKLDLEVSEKALREVKGRHQYELPTQFEANLKTLDGLGLQKIAVRDSLDKTAVLKQNVELQILGTPEFLVTTTQVQTQSSRFTSPALEEFRKLDATYNTLSLRYPERNLSVQNAKAVRDSAKAKLTPQELAALEAVEEAAASPIPLETKQRNPNYDALQGQLRIIDQDIESKQGELLTLDANIAKYRQRIANTPQAEQQMSELERRNDDLRKRYAELNGKLETSRLAESLETQAKGSQFVIQDAANLPLEPSKPQKIVIFAGGMAASLALAIVFAFLGDVARQRVWTQAEIESLWGVPVLIDIPQILTDSDLGAIRRKRYVIAFSSLAFAVAWGVCLYVVYIKQNFVLRTLDPVLQKIVYR